MESQSETTQTVSALKLPVLKTREYDLWSMRMEQYLTFTDHALWEVIVNGDSVIPVASASDGAEGPIPPKTIKQKLARKNELKAKSTLMLAIPDEHLLKFHACKDAKSLWEAIKNRFGGNKESKRIQKTILKQNYENFAASIISQKDANLKLLRSLPSAWNNIALIMRNKYDLDTLSMNDLYNNLKVYESDIKGQTSSSSNSQNVAFVSSNNSSKTNETVNTTHSVSAASSKDQASNASYVDDVMFSFFANQSNAPQLDNEDLEQIDADDLEELDLKWQVAMLTMRVKRRGHFSKECKTPRNQGNRNRDDPRKNAPVDTSTTNALVIQDGICGYDWSFQAEEGITNFALMAYTSQGSSSSSSSDSEREALNKFNLEIIGYQMGLESLEARIVVYEKNEAVYEENIEFLKYDVQVKDISIKDLKNQLEEALKEKDDLKLKLEKFEESSKNLTKLINSQISAKDKTGLGYHGQMNESELNNIHMNESEVAHSVFNSRESDVADNPLNDRFKTDEGFHAVPPPYTGKYMPLRPDLSFAGLDEYDFKSAVKKTTTSVPETETSISKTSKDSVEKPKIVRPSASIIEEWDTDNDNDSVENVKSVNKENTHRQVEYPRKSQSPGSNRRNWNGMMTQKLGNGFEFTKKACFVCGSFNHLIKDCDFHDNKIVEKLVLNNKGKVNGQREIRPVWNNAQRVNHQNKLTHPHPKRNFVPTTIATKSGQVLVNAAKQSSPRAATSISTARPVNTATPKLKVNDALPTTYSYFKAHSPIRRTFNQKSATKINNFNEKVNTPRVNNVTTVGPKAVVSVAEGNRENAVKSSVCWIWRPTVNVIDHISKDSGSYMLKRFDYVDLQDQGIFDSGCSRHIKGNKSFLIDYQEIDGGFVAFGRSPKGGKITRKGKIRTGKLDFKDVYFVKELKFNLFSVSQMCDKKNSVLFTETECLVLSPDFKLLDESQVLLKVPRQNNMYSFDLKNVVPSGGLTCLFAKATIDESNLWHRRLGHINFKTMNKLVRGNLVRGLPSKLFENDHTCVACQKGKQHKASCKTKLVSSISQPLQMLHMDLFGPTFVRSINHKIYCLVVTDDFSRFSWVFFLATKDETSGILKTFITGIENQINHKVKIIRCDNGTEFKNNDMNQFYGMKGIKREFSVARTPQQNGVAKRKNRTLIEAARTMLADSLLPTTFWAEAVNTACYVQNRVLVTKPHNKTPYELLHGRPPSISFMRPFGCLVTILNTLDPLGKFDGKADEGFLIGYSINRKAFRVFNTRTRKVEENMHITFLENKPNVARSGPDWLFDIDLLTNSINYEPITIGNQTNGNAGIKDIVDAVPTQQYILLPLLSDSPHSSEDVVADDAGKKTTEEPANKGERNGQEKEERASNKEGDKNVQDLRTELDNLLCYWGSFDNADDLPTDHLMPDSEDTTNLLNTSIFSGAYDDDDEGAKADLNKLETPMNVSPIPITRIHKDHPKDQIIGDINSATP
ncbi:putative ribonuclease H-like domain-containing protein [Tanacetum coccineum]|uniref:Ribonuclease H-like domain-containing protein n=1 Tax=Tanacetum coccineum TaxID=301880 RepID=A0ABQ5AHB5_9ASTR